jgi:chemotaxis protein histidine kinase CheA
MTTDSDEAGGSEVFELLLEFVEEAEEHLERSEAALLVLEKQPGAKQELDTALRGLHSIKGTAGYVSLFDIQELCHVSEELLGGRAVKTREDLVKARVGLVLDALAAMRRRLEAIRECCQEERALKPSRSLTEFLERVKRSSLLTDGGKSE